MSSPASDPAPGYDAPVNALNDVTPPSPPPPPTGFWSSVKEALRGSHQDFTEGSLPRAIALLAIPMVLEMSMESLFALVDVYFVSHLGKDAVAAVGLTESMMTIVYTVAMGVAVAGTATVARRIGEKDPAAASHAGAQALWLGATVALTIGALGSSFAPELLRVMGASSEVVQTGTPFTRLMLGANVTVLLLFVLNGVFRGAGDAAMAMRSLMIANTINVVLNPCLILGLGPFPQLGLLGSAVATTIGRGTGVAYQLYMLTSGKGRIALDRSHARLDPRAIWKMFRLSLGAMGQMLVSSASWVALTRIIAQYGATALAGYTVAIRFIIVALLPAWGMSNAAATLVGQNLGAGKPERAEAAVWRTGRYNLVFLGAVTVLFVLFAAELVSPMVQDPAVQAIAAEGLRVISYGYVFYAFGMVLVASFNGAGDTFTPTAINLGCFWAFQLPAAWLLSGHFGMGASGVFWAITVAQSLATLVAALLFRRGTWKAKKV